MTDEAVAASMNAYVEALEKIARLEKAAVAAAALSKDFAEQYHEACYQHHKPYVGDYFRMETALDALFEKFPEINK
jgi:uncharacterized protein VirK/YbjX